MINFINDGPKQDDSYLFVRNGEAKCGRIWCYVVRYGVFCGKLWCVNADLKLILQHLSSQLFHLQSNLCGTYIMNSQSLTTLFKTILKLVQEFPVI